MDDRLLTAMTGGLSSLFGMVTGVIYVDNVIEVAVLGVLGGAAGMIGKLVISGSIKLFKKIKK